MASVSLDDIWNAPAEIRSSTSAAPIDLSDSDDEANAPRKRKQPLFYTSDDDEPAPASTRAAPSAPAPTSKPSRPDIDALFENLDEPDDVFQGLAPALDLDQLRREADAHNARAVQAEYSRMLPREMQSSGSGVTQTQSKDKDKKGKSTLVDDDDGEPEQKKKRKPIAKLDEARLLGKDGFPQLLKDTKHFRPRGKGHEAADLDSVLQIYQFWTHRMYSKNKFRDSVQRIEKLCHSKRMHVALSVWRDESKGFINGRRFDDDEAIEPSDNDEPSAGVKRTTATSDADIDAEGSPPSQQSSRPPPSSSPGSSSAPEDEFDIDTLIAEEEALKAQRPPLLRPVAPAPVSYSYTTANTQPERLPETADEDEAMWDALDTDFTAPTPAPPPARAAPVRRDDEDEDEDMWDVVREMEQAQEQTMARPAQSAGGGPPQGTNDEDWDDMYM